MSASRILFLAPLLLAGCDFFTPPIPDDEVLTCGEILEVAEIAPLGGYPIEVAANTSIEVTWDLNAGDSVRLQFEDASGLTRATAVTDPVAGRAVLTGFVASGRQASVDFLFESAAPSGTITLMCVTPGEDCGNLVDDDGDGAIDCSDVNCARDTGCVEGQADFDIHALACTDGWEPLDVEELRSFSSQRTIYRLVEANGDIREEFWGGGEAVIRSSVRDRFVQLRSATGGLACIGQDQETHLVCTDGMWGRLSADEPFVVADSDLPLYVEPLGNRFTDLEVRVDCGTEE
jgi:hypothetical protein